jgi:hypothetical protein
LEVRFSFVVVVVAASITTRINSLTTASKFIRTYLHWAMSKSCRSQTIQCLILKKPCAKLGRSN